MDLGAPWAARIAPCGPATDVDESSWSGGPVVEQQGKRRARTAQAGPLAAVVSLAIAGGLACSLFLIWSSSGPNSALGRLLGMSGVPVSSLPRTLTIAITPRSVSFSPPAAAIVRFGRVT